MTGNKIRKLRERRAWTQEQLAGAASLSTRTVQRAEDGVMSAETRAALAGALDVPVEVLAPHLQPVVQPVLMYEDSRSAVEWLVRAFGFEVRERVADDDGQIIHGELVLGGGVVLVTRARQRPAWVSPRQIDGRHTGFTYVYVEDVDAHYARAVSAGAEITAPPEVSYGQRRYRARDPEGHEWTFSTELER